MNILVGLGNPGEKYQQTRHNAGWMYLDFIRNEFELMAFSDQKKVYSEVLKSPDFILAKPQTFMNDTGKAVKALMKWYGNEGKDTFENLIAVYDDLDIPLGKYKIQFGSGPKVHNGVNSIREHLGTDQFWNIRIGVDNRNGDRSISGSDYVLQKFNNLEKEQLISLFPLILPDLRKRSVERENG